MVTTIGPQTFEIELQGSVFPLLVAFLKRNERYCLQARALERVARTHEGRVRCFLFNPDYLDTAMDRFQVKGTPTFLLLDRGREINRLIGESDGDTLDEFVRTSINR
ncbi:MAG: thioredoxin family protein [Desulfovibrionaceae bacterium]|nr:thioredoxin family protein [Desulfovibrionaceae bacterium]